MALFETPVAHAANYHQNPYSTPEFEDEWATPEANPYGTPEYENEWEMQEANHYNNPYSSPEMEWETPGANPYSSPEMEWEMPGANPYGSPEGNPEYEWEMSGANHYNNPYGSPEMEWEMPGVNPYGSSEYEYEAEFWKKIGSGLKKLVKAAAPLAKRFAPMIAGKLASMIPGVGVLAGPLAAKLTSQLVSEGEMEAEQMEAEFFGMNEAVAEVANTEMAHEAALAEFLATQAAEATNEAEAEAAIGASLPITIKTMGGSKALRSVTPILSQANAAVAGTLVKQGPVGKQLLRIMPTIHRRAIGMLKASVRKGQPITGAMAIKAMAAASHQVLGNPQKVQQAMVRNVALRQRTAPPSPRRAPVGMM